MDQATHNKIVSFIWGIADDVLRDLFIRGKYRDVILPMCVLRRLDAVLEPTKHAVLETKKPCSTRRASPSSAPRCARPPARRSTTRRKFTLRDLKSRGSQQQLLGRFRGLSRWLLAQRPGHPRKLQVPQPDPTLSKADALGTLIDKFLDPRHRSSRPAGIDNHAMGTIFEELVRKFNEENNEEAGEHWTPRDAVKLMANLVFLPIEAQIESGTYLLYDGACGTGGMLTVAEETLTAIANKRKAGHEPLYGQEINPETYAICKADMLLKGEGESADNIVGGAEWSTLSHDAFPAQEFDFMLSNPPYGKSWKKDLEAMGGKEGMRDPRFKIEHAGEELSLVTRSSDGQMLFLANMASKMNAQDRARQPHRRGAQRLVAVHRRRRAGREQHPPLDHRERLAGGHRRPAAQHVLQHRHRHLHLGADQPQARAPPGQGAAHRRHAVVQAAAQEPRQEELRTLGRGHRAHLRHLPRLQGNDQSKIFPNAAFGYWKVTVERPLRLHSQLSLKAIETLRFASGDEDIRAALYDEFGDDALHQVRQGLGRAGKAPGRMGQRRGRRR